MRSLRGILIALAVVATITVTARATARPDEPQPEKRAVVHLGSYAADLSAAGSAMLMAVNLQNNGAAVTLFLDRDGVRLADTRQPALDYAGIDVVGLLEAFVASGGRAVLCPPGAAHAGIGPDHLRPGAEIGSPPVIAELMLGAHVVIDF